MQDDNDENSLFGDPNAILFRQGAKSEIRSVREMQNDRKSKNLRKSQKLRREKKQLQRQAEENERIRN